MTGWKMIGRSSAFIGGAILALCLASCSGAKFIQVASAGNGCDPPDRISAMCHEDLHEALEAAQNQGVPLWLPSGTYRLRSELVIDYARTAGTGFQLISDGAIIDATGYDGRALTITCSGGTAQSIKSCFYFHLQGTLFVNGRSSVATVRIGNNDHSDAHNSIKIDHLVVNNGGSGLGMRMNYVLNSDIFAVADSAGWAGMYLTQVQFSRISGAASGATGVGLYLTDGYTFANTFQALDLEVSKVCLAIDSPYANRNTFVSPYFNCQTPIAAVAGEKNVLFNPSWGASPPPDLGSMVGVSSVP